MIVRARDPVRRQRQNPPPPPNGPTPSPRPNAWTPHWPRPRVNPPPTTPVCANQIQPAHDMPAFTMTTTPTPYIGGAFELVDISHRHGLA